MRSLDKAYHRLYDYDMPDPWWKNPKEWSLQRLWNAIIEYGIVSGFMSLVTIMSGIVSEFPFFYVVIAAVVVGWIVTKIVIQIDTWKGRRRVRTIMTEYQNHKTLSLYEAACLWVEIEPHDPITDQGATAKLSFLKGAVRNDELICAWRSSWTRIHDIVHGIKDKSPTDHQEVSMVALRRYAEKIGNIPLFLRHVSLPMESPKKEDDKKPSAPSTD